MMVSNDSIQVNSTKAAAWVFYVVILFEMLYMSTPFAVFFYSVYGAPLKAMNESPLTGWLVKSAMPHFTQTDSLLITSLLSAGFPLMGIGLVIFLVGFTQVYWSKFRRKGAVVGGLYKYVRHPQYLGWAVFGLGTTLFWSRSIVIIMFVTMLFVYVYLARHEERECLQKYGQKYQDYLNATGRFLPKFSKSGAGSYLPKAKSLTMRIGGYILALIVALSLAAGLRAYSLTRISAIFEKDQATISLTHMPETEMKRILEIAKSDSGVKEKLAETGFTNASKRLVYILPNDWAISELGIQEPGGQGHGPGHGLNASTHFNPDSKEATEYKILFSKAIVVPDATGKNILAKAKTQQPALVLHINLKTQSVIKTTTPSAPKYGDIPVPLF